MYDDCSFSVFLPQLAVFYLFDYDHSSGYEVVSHYGFDFVSLMTECRAPFPVLVGCLYTYLEECLFGSFAHMFFKNLTLTLGS